MQRTSTKIAVLLGALLLIISGAALLSGRSAPSGDEASKTEGSTAALPEGAQASSTTSGNSSAPPEEPRPKPEMLPMPLCWQGLAEYDKNVSFENIRQALDAAVAGPDRYLAGYLQERLTELIGNNPERALQVVDWAKDAQAPYLGVFIEALKASDAVHNPRVVDALLKVGEDKGALLINRGAVMDALDTQKRLTPAALQRVKALALDETLDSTAWLATRTIGRVMKEDFERTGTFGPYWKELMDLSEKSDDMAVRELALEMPSYSNPIIEGESIDRLSKIMTTDRERSVREMAAFRLAVTKEPQKALEAYRTAFPAEHDECVRWAIFRFAVRAAGANALPLLQQFAAQDPRFVEDYQDFQKLYATGTVDFSRIWLGVQERHSCIVEEGAPH
jgi:hypothetical protein